ncbi:metallophosphatase family protein [Yinghuangia sp. KLBMP8922]|uniref:Metallophosphatase family protein n=1 Tax=Yinghuangia soli TaxID=2908204 RepID=A0AA41Q8A5_9ACTN|nr:metallophosphatase family protein [Yinghuangia soli]
MGDVHGCVRHAFGAVVMLQARRGIRLDAVIQVGDLGAYPSVERYDEPTRRFARDHPAQGDFLQLLAPEPSFAAGIRAALRHVPPMLFVSGNHEDHEWLAGLHAAARGAGASDAANAPDASDAPAGSEDPATVPIDPLGAYRHVACGSVVEVAGRKVAFLGLVEVEGYMDLDEDAYARLMAAAPGSADILVTHDGPYGMSKDRRGEVQGSPKLTRLIEHLQPPLHVSGHYHHPNGPRQYGRTTSYALAQLVRPKAGRWEPEPVNPGQSVAPGSIGLLDTAAGTFEYVDDAWLADVGGDALDLAALVAAAC